MLIIILFFWLVESPFDFQSVDVSGTEQQETTSESFLNSGLDYTCT